MKNILVTVNFEENMNRLLDKARDIAQKFAARVYLIHVATPEPDYVGYDVGPQYIRDNRAIELRSEHRQLQSCAQRLNLQGVQTEALLMQGATVETILKESNKLSIDLIITGHHKHYLFYNMFIDGMDAALINRSKTPVLIVPME
jgi:nucleotide-binding universal stress UspA family protein